MKALILISLALMAIFIWLSVRRFGWMKSYIGYSPKWKEAIQIHNVNIWAAVTIIVALLIVAPMIDKAVGHNWQFIGMLLPASLVVMAFCGESAGGAIADMLMWGLAIAYVILSGLWWWLLISFGLFAIVAFATKTIKSSWILWIECFALFAICGVLLT